MYSIKKQSIMPGLISFLIIVILAQAIFAQGFIIPHPIPPAHFPLPKLTEHKVNVAIIDQAARVVVQQVFYNDSKQTIEGNYYFPLPKEASVSNFKMFVDGKVLSGELLEKDKARQIYEDIVRRNIDPALLEYVDHNLFSARIFPIPPHKERKVVLEYSALLRFDGDLVQLTYPLRGQFESERVFHRPPHGPYPPHPPIWPVPPYIIPLDEEKRTSDENEEKETTKITTDINQTIFIDLKSKIPLKNIYSPSHEVDITRSDDHHAKISYEGKRKDSEDNFVLYYSFSQSDFGLNLLTYRPEEKETGFFMLLISPKTEVSRKEMIEKDLVFILDVSGSMEGDKIKQAKQALKYCINHLDERDNFNLITFSTESKLFKKDLVPTSEYRRDALIYIDAIEAKGGTNINEALLNALDQKYDENRPISVVFITDGLPTVGETESPKIITNISQKNKNNVRIFTFGVGYDVNTLLLDKIANLNSAVPDYIEPNENIEQKITSFYDKISHPVLINLALTFGGIQVEDVFPKKLPDLYKGTQLTILGRYEQRKKEEITLTGVVKGKENKFTYEADFSTPEESHNFLPYLWATRKIGYLMDEIRLHGENKELKDEIIRLSKQYGVMSPYTSFLVQEEDRLAFQTPISVTQSHKKELLHQPGVGFKDAEMMTMAVAPMINEPLDKGIAAVKMSKASRDMKEQDSVIPTDFSKRIGNRTFFFKNDFWIDGDYKDEKTIDIKYSSPAYTDLILSYPEMAKYLTLGKKIIFKYKNKFVKISESGKDHFSKDELQNIF